MAPARGLGPQWAVLVGVLVALALVTSGHIVGAGVAMAVTLGAGALLRAVVPSRRIGGLVVRSRAFDTFAMLALAVACLVLAVILKPS
jgi:Protein of unknown function (DUF3017)